METTSTLIPQSTVIILPSIRLTIFAMENIFYQWQGDVIKHSLLGCILIKHMAECVLRLK